MVDVFISYSRADQSLVGLLARAVEAEGYDVWWDAELPPHKSYGDVITEKIAQAKAAIVVWSGEAVKSEWVRAEADMARNQRKLVQTALDGAMPPLPFNQIQYAELSNWRGEADHPGWRKVKTSLAELCGPGAEPRAMPHAVNPSAAAVSPSRWPLFAGIGVGAIGLAMAGVVVFGQQRDEQPEAAPGATASTAPVAASPVPPQVNPTPQPASAEPARMVSEDGPPMEPNPADMTFPDSSTRLLEPSEVYPLGPSTLQIARNEIYARKGMRFKTPFVRDWFSRFAWYKPRFDQVPLNQVEQRNVALIQQAEARYQ